MRASDKIITRARVKYQIATQNSVSFGFIRFLNLINVL